MTQPVIPDVALVDNTEQRTPLVLVLDCSGSMNGEPMLQLNEGLRVLEQELKSDVIASKRVRILVVQFGGNDAVEAVGDWVDAMEFSAPTLMAMGTTPTGQAIDFALAKIEEQKAGFKQAGVAYTRPWLFLMSDGVPSDKWQAAAERCREAEHANKVAVFPIAVGAGAHTDSLGQFSVKGEAAVKTLDGLKFQELFLWLSASMKVVSQSRPGGHAQLPAVDSWSNAPT
jgi:uncharacterized protein YegL